MNLRIAGMVNDSITDGPGLRLAIFAQGCRFNCPNCHNPETHDPKGGYDCSIDTIVETAAGNPLLAGVTFSGGEPFLQAAAFSRLAIKIKNLLPHLTILTFTGYTWEELQTVPQAMELVVVSNFIIDGRFEQDKKSLDLLYAGSKNQRFIDVKKTLEKGYVVQAEFYGGFYGNRMYN
jgi:anaerobic ribonucleoside-triphosphate reductase activating protein